MGKLEFSNKKLSSNNTSFKTRFINNIPGAVRDNMLLGAAGGATMLTEAGLPGIVAGAAIGATAGAFYGFGWAAFDAMLSTGGTVDADTFLKRLTTNVPTNVRDNMLSGAINGMGMFKEFGTPGRIAGAVLGGTSGAFYGLF